MQTCGLLGGSALVQLLPAAAQRVELHLLMSGSFQLFWSSLRRRIETEHHLELAAGSAGISLTLCLLGASDQVEVDRPVSIFFAWNCSRARLVRLTFLISVRLPVVGCSDRTSTGAFGGTQAINFAHRSFPVLVLVEIR